MKKLGAAVWFLISALALAPGARAQDATSAPHIEVGYPGVPLRAAPSVFAARGATVEQGAAYRVVARTADGAWVAIDERGATGWIASGFGALSGDLAAARMFTPTCATAASAANTARPPAWIRIGERGRALYESALRAGRDGRIFTIAGDSNSAWPRSFGRLLTGQYELSADAGERTAAARFDPSFAHVSIAVGGGYGISDMFRTDPRCERDEALVACELRTSNAAVLFVQLGTGDKFVWRDFEKNLRRIVSIAQQRSVVPVLVTKADDMESIQGGAPIGHINAVIRSVAEEFRLPWIDFYAATRTLPAAPNPELPKRPFTQYGLHDEWGYYFHLTERGQDLRLSSTLQLLDVLTRGISPSTLNCYKQQQLRVGETIP